MKLLEAIYSEIDKAGNVYWALRFTDEDGTTVQGTISGGESNIYHIRRCWGDKDEWDDSIHFRTERMGKRDFRRLTAGWEYAGCTSDELVAFIREKLKIGRGESDG